MSFVLLKLLIPAAFVLLTMVSGAVAVADVGKAAFYSSPYTPTECYGGDPTQLPPGNLFAAAGGELWDNGVACGRVYTVRCIGASRSVPSNCANDRPIQVKIIDNALSANSAAAAYKQSATGAPLVLCEDAFNAIAKRFADSIDIEFQEVTSAIGLSKIASAADQKSVQRPILGVVVSILIQILLIISSGHLLLL